MAFRAATRAIHLRPEDHAAHAERLEVALRLPGSEPVQGALADLFARRAQAPAALRAAALAAAQGRIAPLIARSFRLYLHQRLVPPCSRLATRWSVLTQAAPDGPSRTLRCSSDDSAALAAQAVQAWRAGDLAAQDRFLEHCRVCRDSLAMLMARREILRSGHELPWAWAQTFDQLSATRIAA